MARVVLATFGSLGDLHPALALAEELRRRGHIPVIATSEPYRARVTARGIEFAPVRPDLSLANAELVRRAMDGPRGSEYLLRRLVYPHVRAMHTDLTAAAAGADLLVASELACVVPLVAAQRRLPWAFFALAPISFFSVHDPVVLPGPSVVRWLHRGGPTVQRAVRRVAEAVSHRWWTPLRELRRELGLPPGDSPLFAGKYSPHLNLALFSPVLQTPQPDWPAATVQPGFCFYDEATATPADLPAPVAAFLRAGPPPVVFTLGSAAVQLAGPFYTHGAAAVGRLGQRALLLLGPNPPPPSLPPGVLTWDYLPYAAIFPHVAAVVHQGGVGTTAQALRAARPMLIVPYAHDQFDNAHRIVRSGAGRTLARAQFSPARVAQELRILLGEPAFAAAAARGAERLRAEPGVTAAVTALEGLLG